MASINEAFKNSFNLNPHFHHSLTDHDDFLQLGSHKENDTKMIIW